MIRYYEKERIFKIDTNNSSYIFCVTDLNFLEHLYYGKYIKDVDVRYISNRQRYSFSISLGKNKKAYSPSVVGQELSVRSSGDVRTSSISLEFSDKNVSNRFKYVSHNINAGREKIVNLPCSRNSECTTLEVKLSNDTRTLSIYLYYVVYAKQDVICRYMKIVNESANANYIDKVSSACLDFYEHDFDLITLEGMYLCECSKIQRRALVKGMQSISSNTGTTSHHANPFFALVSKNSDENIGEAYGFNLVYSGNFKNEIEVDRLGNTRIVSGINESDFRWKLNSGESFYTPEFVMTYSCFGIGGMSRNMHDHIRGNIIEPKYTYNQRPIVINSWEGFHFGVTENNIIFLTEKAKLCGVDTVVLDDGWFRINAEEGLGDFYTDKNKFPNGLRYLSEKIHDMGLNFGIWIEPEMVSVKSKLYQEDKQIILSTEKEPYLYRTQMVLDLTSEQNINSIVERIVNEFDGVDIEYIKWDFNRYIDEMSSYNTPNGEIAHRQVIGTYKMLERIKAKFPNAIFETCSGGGGRFDLGMLYYSPQIWASDNTDPYARINIQYGYSVAYPPSTISCHFSKGECTSGRYSSFDFRYLVASFGTYGYELNLSDYSESELEQFCKYSKEYRDCQDLILKGDLYRLITPETGEFCAYLNISKDKSEVLLTFLSLYTSGHVENMSIRLKGLDENKYYKNTKTGAVLSGGALMNVGIRMEDLFEDRSGSGRRILFVAV